MKLINVRNSFWKTIQRTPSSVSWTNPIHVLCDRLRWHYCDIAKHNFETLFWDSWRRFLYVRVVLLLWISTIYYVLCFTACCSTTCWRCIGKQNGQLRWRLTYFCFFFLNKRKFLLFDFRFYKVENRIDLNKVQNLDIKIKKIKKNRSWYKGH